MGEEKLNYLINKLGGKYIKTNEKNNPFKLNIFCAVFEFLLIHVSFIENIFHSHNNNFLSLEIIFFLFIF